VPEGGRLMSEDGITYIHVPVGLLSLDIRSAHELALLGLAVSFNGNGIRLSNTRLAQLLCTDRRHVPRLIGRLVGRGYLRVENQDGRRIIHATDTILVSPPDTKVVTKRHQNGDKVTPLLPCPSITEFNLTQEKGARAGKTQIKTSRTEASARTEAHFLVFWKLYPLKKAKVAARKAFYKIAPDATLFEQIVAAVENQARSEQWTKDGGKYIPHPATWLNGGRWEDEPPDVPKAPVAAVVRDPDGLTPKQRAEMSVRGKQEVIHAS